MHSTVYSIFFIQVSTTNQIKHRRVFLKKKRNVQKQVKKLDPRKNSKSSGLFVNKFLILESLEQQQTRRCRKVKCIATKKLNKPRTYIYIYII